MPSRTAAVLAAMALLLLSVGFGSALFLSKAAPAGGKPPGSGSPASSPTPAALFPTPQPTDAPAAINPDVTAGLAPTPGGPTPLALTPVPGPKAAFTRTPKPRATFTRTRTSTPTWTSSPTNTPTATPTLTPRPERTGGPVAMPNRHPGARWVTLQAGHWHTENLPEEQQHLVDHTGASSGGVQEVDVNVAVARLTAQLLYGRGYSVEILAASVPPSYTTDLFIALHADGSTLASTRGFKAVAPWGAVPASDTFVGFLYEEYGKATGLPTDAMTSDNMANYYAFNPIRYQHAILPSVPAALLEMGFVTNPTDRQVLATEQDRLAFGIANAVDRYFRSGAAGPTPSPYPSFTPTVTPTPTRTSTPTPTNSSTPTVTLTPTPLPTEPDTTSTPTGSARPATATRTPRLPTATRTPSPTSTPLTGTITTDGRWLPPLSLNGRYYLPQPGADAAPVLLSSSDDDPHGMFTPRVPGFIPHIWLQYYMPNLGRSIWVQGQPVPTVTPTRTETPTITVTPTVTVTPTREATPTITVTPDMASGT